MARVTFHFAAELDDFLLPARRRVEFEYDCAENATLKHAIEALGVPHTEVGPVHVDGQPAGLDHRLQAGERITVGPARAATTAPALRFLADAHLAGLARLLRLAGFDTAQADDGVDDAAIVRQAVAQQRMVLTRDRELLKRRLLTQGCYVHAQQPKRQLRELFGRLDLARAARPFTRCLECNSPLRPATGAEVVARVPPAVRERHREFQACDGCGRVYWRGSHYAALQRVIDELVTENENAGTRPASGALVDAGSVRPAP